MGCCVSLGIRSLHMLFENYATVHTTCTCAYGTWSLYSTSHCVARQSTSDRLVYLHCMDEHILSYNNEFIFCLFIQIWELSDPSGRGYLDRQVSIVKFFIHIQFEGIYTVHQKIACGRYIWEICNTYWWITCTPCHGGARQTAIPGQATVSS